jgi:hypothetical protein
VEKRGGVAFRSVCRRRVPGSLSPWHSIRLDARRCEQPADRREIALRFPDRDQSVLRQPDDHGGDRCEHDENRGDT